MAVADVITFLVKSGFIELEEKSDRVGYTDSLFEYLRALGTPKDKRINIGLIISLSSLVTALLSLFLFPYLAKHYHW
jgi:hypothetical protein